MQDPDATILMDMARILVADDSPSVRLLVVRHLQTDGHDVREAADGTTAYEIGCEDELDLAILDQLMPGMLGTDILHRWREENHDFPVLLLSAVDDDHTVIQSLQLGAADYIRKPFSMPELKARVTAHLPR
jgi:DNA-binding response OmpR family regulator